MILTGIHVAPENDEFRDTDEPFKNLHKWPKMTCSEFLHKFTNNNIAKTTKTFLDDKNSGGFCISAKCAFEVIVWNRNSIDREKASLREWLEDNVATVRIRERSLHTTVVPTDEFVK